MRLLLILAIVFTVQAQPFPQPDTSCAAILDNTDEMTGESYLSIRPFIVSKDGTNGLEIRILASKSNNSIALTFEVYGAGPCIDKGSLINILFTDSTRMELRTHNEFNCDQEAAVYFGAVFGNLEQLHSLETKRIKAIRVWTTKLFVEETLSRKQAAAIAHAFQCMSNGGRCNCP